MAFLACLLLSLASPFTPKPDFWSGAGAVVAKDTAVAGKGSAQSASDSGPSSEDRLAASIVDRMSDEEVIGQILMMSYPGDTPGPLLFEWVEKRALGGVKIFGWNADDSSKVAAAVAAIQRSALGSHLGIPLLIATDQEGGWIRHIKGMTTATPGNMAIGASGRPYDAYQSAFLIGKELAALGVNMNFAPSVDLATKPKSYIIGPRAFSDDPTLAAVLGSAFVRGLSDAGVIATAKHYPGHGDTEDDSHGVLPVIRVDEKTLWNRELVPYRVLSAEGIPAIMSGHLNFPLISGDGMPASLSRYFMSTLLRDRIGFKGLAVTDDLTMNGAGEAAGSTSEACVKALEAGNDLLMLSRLLTVDDPAYRRLLSAYRENPDFRAKVRKAAAKVIETKLRYLKPRGKAALIPDLGSLAAKVPDPEAATFFAAQAYRSATVIRSAGIPFPAAEGLKAQPYDRLLVAGPFKDFFAAGLAVYPDARTFRFSYEPEATAIPAELQAFDRALSDVDYVLVCVANGAGMDFAVRAHDAGKRVAIVSAQSPAPLARAPWAEASVAVYSYSSESLRAGIAVIDGSAKAPGKLPVRLPR
jgi:beta-N-acetylhexosaminidase